MKKNDITYEYRVFTHRPIDIETMEVGRCTSKVIKELKSSDKVDGRFFHTSDTDEWFFCWNGNLQKLNLKGNADVNAALEEVNRLIAEANNAVDEAKKTASEAKDAADNATAAAKDATAAVESIDSKADKGYVDDEIAAVNSIATEAKATADAAKDAADNASAAVENIGNKADKSEVEAVSKAVEEKADKSVVDTLSAKVDAIPSLDGYATKEFVGEEIEKIEIPTVPTNVSAFTNDAGYLTHQDISGKQDVIADLATIRANAELGAKAIQKIPDTYATKEYVGEQIDGINLPTNISEFTNDAGYLTKDVADGYYAALGTTGSGDGVDKNYVDGELAKKQNIIDDLEDIRTKANNAIQSIPDVYVTDEELEGKGYLTEHQDISGKQNVIENLDAIIAGAAKGATALQASDLNGYGYLTEDSTVIAEINSQIAAINALLGNAEEWTDTILKA